MGLQEEEDSWGITGNRSGSSCVACLVSWPVWDLFGKISAIIAARSTCALATGREGSVPSKPKRTVFYQAKKTLYPFNCKLWVNALIHSEREADGNKPHACGLSHFFHICILKTTFGARGLTSVSLACVYESNGHMSSCRVGKCVQGIRR